MAELVVNKDGAFDDIRRVNENDGREYWSARDLMKLLEYNQWRNFLRAINDAKDSYRGVHGETDIENHFADAGKMVKLGSNTSREIEDYHLSRYACYLIAQNGDPKKEQVARAQTYFAVQTYRQEQFDKMSEEQKRLYVRGQVTTENKKLFDAAREWGVESQTDFANFNNDGYKGLYGMTAKQIKKRKGLGKDKLLDRAGTTELAANLFRITQTQDRLSNDNAEVSKRRAGNIHFMVGGKVRQTIKDIGGTLPEDLLPEVNIKQIEQKEREKLGGGKTKELESKKNGSKKRGS